MASLKMSAVENIITGSNIPQTDKDALMREAMRSAAEVPDTWIYRIVVIALGLAIFIPLVPVLIREKDMAVLLLPIATGALGALAGLLAPSPAA